MAMRLSPAEATDAIQDFTEHMLDSYQHTVDASQERQKNGKMTTADLLKIQLQTLQFQNDVTAARIALVQALNTLRELMGFDSVPRDYDIVGDLGYTPITLTLSDLQTQALVSRPDLEAARRGVTAATRVNIAAMPIGSRSRSTSRTSITAVWSGTGCPGSEATR